jgi:hypothetical protein
MFHCRDILAVLGLSFQVLALLAERRIVGHGRILPASLYLWCNLPAYRIHGPISRDCEFRMCGLWENDGKLELGLSAVLSLHCWTRPAVR